MFVKKTAIKVNDSHVVSPTARIPVRTTPRIQKTLGRFTTDVENFHGRLAMLGITGCALDESIQKLPIVQQWVSETGVPAYQLFAFVAAVTTVFVLETINPVVTTKNEKELDVFSNPGFTLETEILHGRIAMLAFAYAVLIEQVYSTLVL